MEVDSGDVRVRELLAVLVGGVTVRAFSLRDEASASTGPTGNTSQFWFDLDTLRLCVDKRRPSLVEKHEGTVIPRGLYVRDVSVVQRARASSSTEEDAGLEFIVIGTEDAFVLHAPSSSSRDWFVERLVLLVEEINGADEARSRVVPRILLQDAGERQHIEWERMRLLLQVGIEVNLHRNGVITPSILRLSGRDQKTWALGVFSRDKSSIWVRLWDAVLGRNALSPLALMSIVEVRARGLSKEFVRTAWVSESNSACSLSLIGPAACLCLSSASSATAEQLRSQLLDFISAVQSGLV